MMEYVIEVYRQQSFTKAAENLHIAQPSLSQQIKKLEEKLDTPLFIRKYGQVTPTPQGTRLIKRAENILKERNDLLREMEEASYEVGKELMIGAPAVTGGYVLPGVLKTFCKTYPHVHVHLIEESPRELERLLLAGKLDLAILSLPVEHEQLKTKQMLTEPLLLAVPQAAEPWLGKELNDIIHQADQKGIGGEAVPFHLLEGVPFIMLKEGYGFRKVVTELCRHHGFRPRIAFETSHIQTAQALVKNELGVTVVPKMVAKEERGQVIYLPIESCPTRTLVFAYVEERYVTKAAQALMDLYQSRGEA
ncbi:LysR family transcriptional regulator [Bacillus xiamenensis]|uniref:LysR family transcriptional regulator n=1 Tax=Bacillus xiamenensis TaxID=1178537 RepID=A0AAC9IEZ3_9BACI|nr:LysR substrate-binding domain-containing protein [Bacillus xiamenensis]AOZ88365.1 LysR family transcriptional regulator [Bacillus xiamenensis]EKF33996.1 LysR family transcriptional regulator [Bacillus xiamenensis]QGX67422.1 LysR family transcriptional regulator [Bacillus sp. ms-22]